MAGEECREAVAAYLEWEPAEGEEDPFGGRDPFVRVTGGVLQITRVLLAVSTDTEDYPTDDNSKYSARLFGELVGKASAEMTLPMLRALDTYMELARDGNGQNEQYKKAKKEAAEMRKEEDRAPKSVSREEISRIESRAGLGMPMSEAVALRHSLVLGPGHVIGRDAAEKPGAWDIDPHSIGSFKDRKKLRLQTYGEMLDGKCGVSYASWLNEIALSLNRAGWNHASSTLMRFVQELSMVTIQRGQPELFVAYMERFMQGIMIKPMRAEEPLDQGLLNLYVFSAPKPSVSSGGGGAPKPVAASQGQGADLDAKYSEKFDALCKQNEEYHKAMQRMESKIGAMSTKLDKPDPGAGGSRFSGNPQFGFQPGLHGGRVIGPPSELNPCDRCGGADHFARECTMPAAEAAKAKAEREAERKAKGI